MTGEEFGYALLEKHHIAVMPGESFGEAAAGTYPCRTWTIETRAFCQALAPLCDFAERLR